MDGWVEGQVGGWMDGWMGGGRDWEMASLFMEWLGRKLASPQHQGVVTLIPLGMQRIDIWLSVPGAPS